MQKEIYDVIVVGAGIVGCSTSYHLAKSGLKVALVDKGGTAGEASHTTSRLNFSRDAAGTLYLVISFVGMPLGKLPGKRRHSKPRESIDATFHDGISLCKFLFQF